MIKRTTVLDNGVERTSVALNDAVKKRSGYCFMFGGRWQDLRNRQAIISQEDVRQETLIGIGEYDPTQQILFFVALLAHPEMPFPAIADGAITVAQHVLGDFRIVVLSTLFPIPSDYTRHMGFGITAPPEKAAPEKQELAHLVMKGTNTEVSLELYKGMRDHFMNVYINDVLSVTTDQSLIEQLKSVQRTLNPGFPQPLGPGIGPRSVRKQAVALIKRSDMRE